MITQRLMFLASSCRGERCAPNSFTADVIVVSAVGCLVLLTAGLGLYRDRCRRRPYVEQVERIRTRFNGRTTVRVPVRSTVVTIEEITRIGIESGYAFRDVARNSSGPLWVRFQVTDRRPTLAISTRTPSATRRNTQQ